MNVASSSLRMRLRAREAGRQCRLHRTYFTRILQENNKKKKKEMNRGVQRG